MMDKGTAAPGRSGKVSGGPRGKTALGVERPGDAPGGELRATSRRSKRMSGGYPEGSGAALRLPEAARLAWAGKVIAVALALGMLLSPALWLSRPSGAPLSESFPLVPPLSGMEILALPAPLDTGLLGLVLALCALAVVTGGRAVYAVLLAALVLLVLPDLMRWQPWVYLYLATLGTLVLVPARSPGAPRILAWVEPLTVMRIIVASVYAYSGLNKLNAAFFSEGLRGFLAGMPRTVGSGPVADMLTYSAPALEIAAGLGLFLGALAGMRRVCYAALGLAVSTNLFVLVALVAAGANQVVWPWNVAMIFLVVVLYAGKDRREVPLPRPGPRRRCAGNVAALRAYGCALLILVLAAVMPLFGVLGYWPSYLSYALYSANTSGAIVDSPGPSGALGITTVASLSYEQLGVPAYPARAVYEAMGKQACGGREVIPAAPGGSGAVVVLTVESRPDLISGAREVREYSCLG